MGQYRDDDHREEAPLFRESNNEFTFTFFRNRRFYESDLMGLTTLSEVESIPKKSSPETEETSHDTETSPTNNVEMSPVIEN